MKGVVTEIRGSMAALLSEEGCMVKVKNRSYEIGQEVEMKMKNKTGFKRTGIATAAGLLIAMGIGTVAYCTPAHYVSLDVNPSIEYKVNMFDRVIAVTGANQDGKDIIDGIQKKNLKNKDIKEAVTLTVDKIAEEGYLQGEGSGIVIATTKDADKLKQTAEKACEENKCEAEVQAEGVGKARVEEAAKYGITPGKLNLIEKLWKSHNDGEITDDFIKGHQGDSVKDIMAAINGKTDKEQPKDKTNQNNGNDKANGNSNVNVNRNNNSNGSGNSDGKSTQNSNSKVNPENKGNIKGNSKGTSKN